MITHTLIVEDVCDGQRLDVFLAQAGLGVSRSAVKGLVRDGAVRVGGKLPKPSTKVRRSDTVDVLFRPSAQPRLIPEWIPLDVLYEDQDLIVINKKAGMVVHPSCGQTNGTLVHALLARCPEIGALGDERPGIVHRLDKGTSGAIVIAKHSASLAELGRQFKVREVKKEYLAVVHGAVALQHGVIEKPIGRHPSDRKRMSVVSRRGRDALTEWAWLRGTAQYTLLRVHTKTGRTHQIRVHLSYAGHPLVGDVVYGGKMRAAGGNGRILILRPALHASLLGFRQPRTRQWIEVTAPPAGDFQELLRKIENQEDPVDKECVFV